MYSALAARGTLNRHRAASILVRLVEGEEKGEAADHIQVFSLKIGVELNQIAQSSACYSKLLTSIGIHLALCRDDFRDHRSDLIRQVTLVTTLPTTTYT
ncbi:hypothetical protein TNCV_840911 [Trichonephila clavipes]|nr:hypothetical protein TNCV_840911 [Trichonephila clavipes]